MVAFPIVKLGALAVKQISKPLAKLIQQRAKSNPFFRKYVCMPPAQSHGILTSSTSLSLRREAHQMMQAVVDIFFPSVYHWIEVNFRLRLMGLGRAQHVEKLSEDMAIELGADILGEFVIFSIAAATLMFEYQRSAKKEDIKEEKIKQEKLLMKQKIQDLDLIVAVQQAQIKGLQRDVDALEAQNKDIYLKVFGTEPPKPHQD